MQPQPPAPLVAIACGGTGGHLFPGLAVAEELKARHCDITLLVSPKEVDRQAARSAVGMEVVPLPVVALSRGRLVRFIHGYGTGQLKRALAGFLQQHPLVARFATAPPNQGGGGVTVVELKD